MFSYRDIFNEFLERFLCCRISLIRTPTERQNSLALSGVRIKRIKINRKTVVGLEFLEFFVHLIWKFVLPLFVLTKFHCISNYASLNCLCYFYPMFST